MLTHITEQHVIHSKWQTPAAEMQIFVMLAMTQSYFFPLKGCARGSSSLRAVPRDFFLLFRSYVLPDLAYEQINYGNTR